MLRAARCSGEAVLAAVSKLQQQLGPEKLTVAAAVREQHGKDLTYHPGAPPDAVVFPSSTADVVSVMKAASEFRIPVIPYGAGTSLEGHFAARFGGLCVDMQKMNRVVSVRPEDLDCTVEAGVTRLQLNEYLRDTGLFFPVDPGADATLGGMASTRASGTNAVRYGTMRDLVLSLRVVMPDGRIVTTASRARKSSAGYGMTGLFVGSEGTLGIITELTLKLFGQPAHVSVARCAFPDIDTAVETVQQTIQLGIPVARCELLDEDCMAAVMGSMKVPLPDGWARWKPTLFFEFHGASQAAVEEQTSLVESLCTDAGGSHFQYATSTEERNQLWKARHHAWFAVKDSRPGCSMWSTDVCVPISRLAEAIHETRSDVAELGLKAPILGHVGDGKYVLFCSSLLSFKFCVDVCFPCFLFLQRRGCFSDPSHCHCHCHLDGWMDGCGP